MCLGAAPSSKRGLTALSPLLSDPLGRTAGLAGCLGREPNNRRGRVGRGQTDATRDILTRRDILCPLRFSANPALFSMPRNARCVLPGSLTTSRSGVRTTSASFFSTAITNVPAEPPSGRSEGARAGLRAHDQPHPRRGDPEAADFLAIFFRRVHGRYAQYVNTRRGRSGHLWQGRFYWWCAPGDGASLCEENPCRAHLVEGAAITAGRARRRIWACAGTTITCSIWATGSGRWRNHSEGRGGGKAD